MGVSLRLRFGVGLYATSPHRLTPVAGFPLLSLTRKQIHIHAKNPTSQTNYGDF